MSENRRREGAALESLYAPWNRAEHFIRFQRSRHAIDLLRRVSAFPGPDAACLEIGFGRRGWIPELLAWGVREGSIHGVEIDSERCREARLAFPSAHLELASGEDLPWGDEMFHLVVASTVFSSILCQQRRSAVAREIVRVLRPGGALVWFDFRTPSPSNPRVSKVPKSELLALFPQLDAAVRSVVVAPPLLRAAVGSSSWLASTLELVPFLRTHLIAVLVKRVSQ